MSIDMFIPVSLAVITVAIGYLGVHLTLHPLPVEDPALRRAQMRYKVSFVVLSLVGVALIGWQAARSQVTPSVWHRPITAEESKAFVTTLSREPHSPSVRIGCAANDEAACVLASQLIVQFQTAGWKVEKLPAERLMLPRALLGVAVFAHGTGVADPSNSRSGLWVAHTPTLTTLSDALRELGINAQVTADAAMPDGVFGIYCGPDPGPRTPYYAE
ncbi:MAG: hypothetical protein ACSLFQ_04730 [Thermoanaerobaculia bacterium]